jgi:ectoine hydrolase
MRKCDLVAEIYDAGTRGVDGIGGDYPAIVPLLPSGADASAPHLTWDDRPMKSGEGTFFEIAGATTAIIARFRAPSSSASRRRRSSMPKRRRSKAWKPAWPRRKPGNTCEDIANAFFAVLKKYGIIKDNRTGYGDRPVLPAGLGRAHDEPASRRPDRIEARHDLPFHDRPLARRHGFRDHGKHR